MSQQKHHCTCVANLCIIYASGLFLLTWWIFVASFMNIHQLSRDHIMQNRCWPDNRQQLEEQQTDGQTEDQKTQCLCSGGIESMTRSVKPMHVHGVLLHSTDQHGSAMPTKYYLWIHVIQDYLHHSIVLLLFHLSACSFWHEDLLVSFDLQHMQNMMTYQIMVHQETESTGNMKKVWQMVC